MSILNSTESQQASPHCHQLSQCTDDEHVFHRFAAEESSHRNETKCKNLEQLAKLGRDRLEDLRRELRMYDRLCIESMEKLVQPLRELTAQNLRESKSKQLDLSAHKAAYNANPLIKKRQKQRYQLMAEVDIARKITLGQLVDIKRSFVSDVQLIECRLCLPHEMPDVSAKEAGQFNFFYMKKIYTINGQKYIASHIFKVVARPDEYDTYLTDQPDSLSLPYYENLKHAKTNFLSNNDHSNNCVAAHAITTEQLIAQKIVHTLDGPVKSTFLQLKHDPKRYNRLFLSKLVEVNKIAYIIETECTTDGSTQEEVYAKEKFMNMPLRSEDKFLLMSSNYREFDAIKMLIDNELKKPSVLEKYLGDEHCLEEFINYVTFQEYCL